MLNSRALWECAARNPLPPSQRLRTALLRFANSTALWRCIARNPLRPSHLQKTEIIRKPRIPMSFLRFYQKWGMPCSESIAPVTHMEFCLFMFCEQYSTLEMHRSETLAPVTHLKSSLFVLCEQYSPPEMQRSESLAPVTHMKFLLFIFCEQYSTLEITLENTLVCYGVLLLAADGNGPFPPVRLRSARQGNGATIMMEAGLLVRLLLLMICKKSLYLKIQIINSE